MECDVCAEAIEGKSSEVQEARTAKEVRIRSQKTKEVRMQEVRSQKEVRKKSDTIVRSRFILPAK